MQPVENSIESTKLDSAIAFDLKLSTWMKDTSFKVTPLAGFFELSDPCRGRGGTPDYYVHRCDG